ncbi:MAG: chromate resistance protein [Rhodocyclaceae bacterium]|nr:chromate resistance protein [Rhodocyclaceae bacterium]
MIQLVEWLVLVTTLPTRNAAARMRLWRAIKTLGCAALRDGVYLLPARDETGAALRALADDVRNSEGSAEVLYVAADGAQDEAFRQLFDRSADYGALIAETRSAGADEKSLRRLTRELAALEAADYFPDAARHQAQQALTELAALLSPNEPQAASRTIRRLASADFSGRTWATRKNIWVDRMASAWLIRRFIDPRANFLWLETPGDCPPDALGFDFDHATFTHVSPTGQAPELVSFEVLAASFGLDADPAIAKIGAIIHYLDVGGAPLAEASGIEAVLAGLRAGASDDEARLTAAGRVLDGLYTNYQQP